MKGLDKNNLVAKRTTKQIGDLGEAIAKQFLITKGYEICNLNYRYRRAEVDIIAKYCDVLIFIEVKSKSYTFYGEPSESVTTAKERMYFDAANNYMVEYYWEGEIRFDIISIVLDEKDNHKITHFEDAFFAGL